MAVIPKRSIPSMATEMQGLRVKDKTEKALMVRIGVLIDAVVAAQRGIANAGQGGRRVNINNLNKPKTLIGSTENLFNAISVTLEPTSSANTQSHQEIQIDTADNFSNPTTKKVFANNTTFKGLIDSTTYNIRARVVTKDGQISPWALLDPVTTTSSTSEADIYGTSLNATAISKTFTLSSASQEFFCASALGFTVETATATVGAGETGPSPVAADTETTATLQINIDSGGYVTVETITLPGIASSAMTANANGAKWEVNVKRSNPIIFFTLVQPDTSSFPGTALLRNLINGIASTEDTVWVEF
jgi:hypothetical protein